MLSASTSVRRSGVQISNVVEEGQVEYVAVSEPFASTSRSVKSPVIGRKRKASALSGQKFRNQFEVGSPVTRPRKNYLTIWTTQGSVLH